MGREVDPTEPVVVSVTRFHAGTANNVIPGEAVIRRDRAGRSATRR